MARVSNDYLRDRFGSFDDQSVEHFCVKHPDQRVYPYSKAIQALKIEAPETGKLGYAVLLQTLNAGLGPTDLRWAVCMRCSGVSQCTRRTRGDVVKSILSLRGLKFRDNAVTREVARRLEAAPTFVPEQKRRKKAQQPRRRTRAA